LLRWKHVARNARGRIYSSLEANWRRCEKPTFMRCTVIKF
jgi:hypothetical protein